MADKYNFQYLPLTGKLSGKDMLDQTERAINDLGNFVLERSVDPTYIEGLANQANENSEEALEVANQALATTGRTYVTESEAVDVNDYYDSELIYIADDSSSHIPEASTGFLTVLTNYEKSEATQIFNSDETGKIYVRYAVITSSTVGDTTVYSATWGNWSTTILTQSMITTGSTFGTISVAGTDVAVKDVVARITALESLPHFEYDDDELYLVY